MDAGRCYQIIVRGENPPGEIDDHRIIVWAVSIKKARKILSSEDTIALLLTT